MEPEPGPCLRKGGGVPLGAVPALCNDPSCAASAEPRRPQPWMPHRSRQEWFEDPQARKAWHNYGFDRHVLYNEGIDCQGFYGDTMHMARLWDSSREKRANGGGYSLEALTRDLLGRRKVVARRVALCVCRSAWHSVTWHAMVRHDTARHGTTRHDMT